MDSVRGMGRGGPSGPRVPYGKRRGSGPSNFFLNSWRRESTGATGELLPTPEWRSGSVQGKG